MMAMWGGAGEGTTEAEGSPRVDWGLTMMAMPEKSTAETNCQTLGRHQEEGHGQVPCCHPQTQGSLFSQDVQRWLVCGQGM